MPALRHNTQLNAPITVGWQLYKYKTQPGHLKIDMKKDSPDRINKGKTKSSNIWTEIKFCFLQDV